MRRTNAGVEHFSVGSQGLIQLPKHEYLLSFQMRTEDSPCLDDVKYMLFNFCRILENKLNKFLLKVTLHLVKFSVLAVTFPAQNFDFTILISPF